MIDKLLFYSQSETVWLTAAYQRYLENRLRDHFNFEGVPLRVFFRKK